jgi:hypothetical protein
MGIPNDYQEHLRVMADLLVLAFQSDLTRIATFVFANDGSNRSYRNVDVADGHHDLSHHGGDPLKQARIARINRFHLTQFAYLVDRLKGIKEGDGTLLDHSMILFGSGISDGNLHSRSFAHLARGQGPRNRQAGAPPAVRRGDAAYQSLCFDAEADGGFGGAVWR